MQLELIIIYITTDNCRRVNVQNDFLFIASFNVIILSPGTS